MLAIIDRDGTRRPLTIPLGELLPMRRAGELLRQHGIPSQDRMELARALRADYRRQFSAGLIRRAQQSDGRYRRFWDSATEEMESTVDALAAA